MRHRIIITTLALLAEASAPLTAQVTGPEREIAPQRAELERRVRERTAEIVRRRLQLNDDQMSRLRVANQQFDQQRMALVTEERQARLALRSELVAGDAANQQKVGALLDQLMRLQRRRLDLMENEQRELGKFLTPVQRAKYFGLQTQLRKRMQELRDRAQGRPAAEGPLAGPRVRRRFR